MKVLTLVLVVCCNVVAFAQKENNVWVGGQLTALDFNTGSVQVFSRDSTLDVWRSNASICNSDGELLFYTNGYRVYNMNFQLMQNGNALEIGDYESWGYEQAALPDGVAIVPIPNSPDKYY